MGKPKGKLMLLNWGKDLDRFTEQVDTYLIKNPECFLVVGSSVFIEFREGAREGVHESLYEHPRCARLLLGRSGTYLIKMGYANVKCVFMGLMWGNIPITCSKDVGNNEVHIISIKKALWSHINEMLEGTTK